MQPRKRPYVAYVLRSMIKAIQVARRADKAQALEGCLQFV